MEGPVKESNEPLIEPNLFLFYDPSCCSARDLYDRPQNNIQNLPNEILEFMADNLKSQIDNSRQFVIIITLYCNKADKMTKSTNELKFVSTDDLLDSLTKLYQMRRTYIGASKMGFRNSKHLSLFGTNPEKCSLQVNGIDFDRYLLTDKIRDKIKHVNRLYEIYRILCKNIPSIYDEFTISEKVKIMEANEQKIIQAAKKLNIL